MEALSKKIHITITHQDLDLIKEIQNIINPESLCNLGVSHTFRCALRTLGTMHKTQIKRASDLTTRMTSGPHVDN